MSVLYIVLPLALLFAGAAVIAFIWAARQGQFDDLLTPSIRMLHDPELPNSATSQIPPPPDQSTAQPHR